MPSEKTTEDQLARLTQIMARLRDPKTGCPWDVQQTMSSLTRYTLEEAYEVVAAIEQGLHSEICEELGDLLFQVVFYARIAQEQGEFDLQDVAKAISDKLIRRHPHVFADGHTGNAEHLSAQWEAIKAQEKAAKGQVECSLLDTVPSGLPALMFAQKLQKACAKVGFDWPDIAPVLDKVREEIEEIAAELTPAQPDHTAIEEEIGDALFAMVNLARHAGVDADTALRKASHKFASRFRNVENMAKSGGHSLTDMSLDEMEALWQEVKRQG